MNRATSVTFDDFQLATVTIFLSKIDNVQHHWMFSSFRSSIRDAKYT